MRTPRDFLYYLQAPPYYFYQWEDEGEVIGMPNIGTICYRGYLIEVLESLLQNGTPSVGALLLCILATSNQKLERYFDELEEILTDCYEQQYPHLEEHIEADATLAFLKTLSRLPAQFHTGARRMQVLQTIFWDGHNLISGKLMNRLLTEAKEMPPDYSTLCFIKEEARVNVGHDIRPLALLNDKFPDTTSILAAVAALPPLEEPLQLPESLPAASDLPPANFLEELEQNETTFPIGALLPSIWAGLHIPLHNRQPSTQPLGGISDISNRGTLDKLLISEHAYDDVLALSRLANGEALYYRREVPPEAQSRGRTLLLDVSLQGWGTPHTVNFALLIAIAAHPKTDIACTAFAVGDQVQPLKFRTVHEVIDSLSLLQTPTDAAGGTATFLSSEEMPKGDEIFFLTSPAGFRQPAVQQLLSAQKSIQYCLVASAAGECTVYKRVGPGLEKAQSFTLPLEKLWQRKAKKTAPSEALSGTTQTQNVPTPAPAYPILFPRPTNIIQVLTAPDGVVYVVSKKRTLFHSVPRVEKKYWDRGYISILENLPAGPCRYELNFNKSGETIFLCYAPNTRQLLLYNLATKKICVTAVSKKDFGRGMPQFVPSTLKSEEQLFLMRWGNKIRTISLREGDEWACEIMIDVSDCDEENFEKLIAAREIRCKATTGSGQGDIYKNIKEVSINADKRLSFDGIELWYSDYQKYYSQDHSREKLGAFYLSRFYAATDTAVKASLVSNRQWLFRNGSKVTINENGMLILESDDPVNETVYLPLLFVGSTFGAATVSHFAGHPAYRPPSQKGQKVISPPEFYRLHIQLFIDRILAYEA